MTALNQLTCKQPKRKTRIQGIVSCIVSLAIIAHGFIPNQAAADNGNVPLDLQAKLLLTALTYDKNMQKKTDEQLDIAILYFPWIKQSREEAENFSKTLEQFKDKQIGGRSFNTLLLSYNGDAGFKEKIAGKHVEVLFIAGGTEPQLKEITRVTREAKILSCTSKSEYVSAYGVTIGVGMKDNKPKIYLNLSSAKSEGADFSAKFLRVAEIVEKEESEDRSQTDYRVKRVEIVLLVELVNIMAKVKRFEELECWREARNFVQLIYGLTKKDPFRKDFELVGQIKRSAISSMANIAEGFHRNSSKDFMRFLDYSRSSIA